jgi:hypothetical protein
MMEEKRSNPLKREDSTGQTQEPTVLDWVKSILRFSPIPIPEKLPSADKKATTPARRTPRSLQEAASRSSELPAWSQLRFPLALILAVIAQFTIESIKTSPECCSTRHYALIFIGLHVFIVSSVILVFSLIRGDFHIEPLPAARGTASVVAFRPLPLLYAVVFSMLTYLTSSEDTFRLSTVVFWAAALISALMAFWEGEFSLRPAFERWKNRLQDRDLKITLDTWSLLVLLGFGLSMYFRILHLNSLPPEMVSDHAEKLLDVMDVLAGKTSIFFPRNTGREAMQFYMAAATAKWLGTGISYMTLKIGTVLAGLLTLPYIYLLGKEVGGREVGLAGMVLAGIGYWPNVISRVGLRFPLYPLFVAPAMYYLVRGIRRKRMNDLLLCGLAVGLGLHGYSPARVIPIVIVLGVALYLLQRESRGQRWAMISRLIAIGFIALVVSLPLLRVAIERPDEVFFRTLTRVGDTEREIGVSPLKVFAANVIKGLGMFVWDDGEVWVNSIPHRPALDWITAALFLLGLVFMFVRYVRERNWVDLFLILSIPFLQLPSTLSIAFPNENPATNRAAGAFVPAFVIAGIALAAVPAYFRKLGKERRHIIASAVSISVLLLVVAVENYQLVFDEYAEGYRRASWNTSDAGEVIEGFAESVGSYDTAYVVAYAYWMDTRLVGIDAGQPARDYAIWADDFEALLSEPRAMLFIINPGDQESVSKLVDLFPSGTLTRREYGIEGKDLLLYFVPRDSGREGFERHGRESQ